MQRGTQVLELFLLEEPGKIKGNFMKAKDLDKIFDDGEVNINDYLDLPKAFRPGQEHKRVNVNFPIWMLESIDKKANRLGVPRQSLIKVWIGEHFKSPRQRSKRRASKAEQVTT